MSDFRCPHCDKLLMRDNAIKCRGCKEIVPIEKVEQEDMRDNPENQAYLLKAFKEINR